MICLVKSGKLQLISTVLMALLFCPVLSAQLPLESGWVKFGPAYEFRDGFYATIDMVKANRPIHPARVVSKRDRFDKKFYKRVLSAEEIVLHDDQGVRTSLKTREIWGYAFQGELYIQLGGRFHRLNLEGAISRFLASSTTWQKVYDPRDKSSDGYTTNKYYGGVPIYANVTLAGHVYLLDLEENVVKGYHPETMMLLLERDTVLYLEYENLEYRQREKQMQQFIARYNQRNPIYFPASGID